MTMNQFNFKRSVVASTLATLLYAATPAMAADSFGGTVKGQITSEGTQALSNATIVLKHNDKGFTRTVQTDENGEFSARKLPVGSYTVTIQKPGFVGKTEENVLVRIGNAFVYDVDLAKVGSKVERIEISGAAISRVDTATSNAGITITSDELALLPVNDGFSNIAMLSPGVNASASFGPNSIGGSSSAENGYYLNGLNVTNIRKGMGEINLPFEAISQTQVKSGGIAPEFGGALGGIVNAVSKSGSNDYDFGVSARFDLEAFRSRHDDIVRLNGRPLSVTKADESDYTEYRIWGSGPIIEDKVFAYVLLQPEKADYKARHEFSAENGVSKTNSWFAKFDWFLSDEHVIEVTGIGFETKDNGKTYDYNPYENGDVLGDYRTDYKEKRGGEVFGAKYTGFLTDDVSLDVIFGRTTEQDYNTALDDLPGVWDERGDSTVTLSNHTKSSIEDGKYTRDQLRADLVWELDDHSLKFGVDHYKIDVDYTFVQNGLDDARGWWSIYTATGTDHSHLAAGTDYIERRIRGRFVNSEVTASAIYAQDSWQVNDQLVLNLGLRYSNQSNTVSDGRKYVDLKGQLAPRLQAIYDINGDGAKKAFFTFGRYFQPVSANMNITQGSAQRETFDYYAMGEVNADGTPVLLADGSPSRGAAVRDQRVRQQGITEPGLIASSNLEGMYSDEITLGYEQEILDGDMSAGVRLIYRELGASLEDTDMAPVLGKKLEELGIEDNVGQGSYYVLYNPGRDVEMSYDFDGDGTVDVINMTAEELAIPDPERTYSSVEFTLKGQATPELYVNASYTWAHSYGMTEGLVKSDTDRAAPGWTTSYDYADLMDHGKGNLPNDRRHSFKFAGTYKLTDDLTLGFNAMINSGTPINKFGIHPRGVDSCAEGSPWDDCISYWYGAYSFYDWQGNPVPRGTAGRTPWTKELDLSLTYKTELFGNDLSLTGKIYNVFNTDGTVKVDQENAMWAGDEIVQNPEWGRTTGRIGSRFVSLSARLVF